MNKPEAAKLALVPTALVVSVLVALWPALPALDSAVIGDGGDNYQFLGFQYLAHRLAAAGQFPFGWTDLWRYPYGIEFQSACDSTLVILFGLPLYPLLGDPIRVYNVSVIALVAANVSLSYLAFRAWFRPVVALLGAILFGLSFYSLGKIGGHVNLIPTAGFALSASAVYRIRVERASPASLARLVLACLVVAFSSLQHPLLLAGSLPFLTALAVAYFPAASADFMRILWRRRLAVAVSAAALVGAFGLFHGRKLAEAARGEVVLPPETIVSVPAVNFVVPNRYLATVANVVSNSTRPWIEYTVFFGYVEIILFAVALWRLERSPLQCSLVAGTAVFCWISLGLWPYEYLFRHMPYRGIIEPARFSTFAYLGMTILILMFLDRIKRNWLLLSIGILLMAERLPRNFHLSPTHRDPELVAAVRSRPTKAVLDLPAYASWWNGQLYDLYSAHHGLPIVLGYFHWSGDSARSSTWVRELREFTCHFNPEEATRESDPSQVARKAARIRAELRERGVRTVVIHKDLFRSDAECGSARLYIEALVGEEEWEVLLDTTRKRVLWRR